MAASFIIEEKNLEIYSLVCLDISSNILQENNNVQQTFRALINHLKIFDDINQCEKYMRSLSKHDRVIFIVNDYDNRELITGIHDLPQMYSIYIYSKNNKQTQQWINKLPKIKGVMTQLKELIAQIHSDQTKVNESISINIFDTNLSYESSTTGLKCHSDIYSKNN